MRITSQRIKVIMSLPCPSMITASVPETLNCLRPKAKPIINHRIRIAVKNHYKTAKFRYRKCLLLLPWMCWGPPKAWYKLKRVESLFFKIIHQFLHTITHRYLVMNLLKSIAKNQPQWHIKGEIIDSRSHQVNRALQCTATMAPEVIKLHTWYKCSQIGKQL